MPEPTGVPRPPATVVRPGTANVDGDPREWTSADRFADLAEWGSWAGPDLGSLSLRYDCTARVLYLYVDAERGAPLKTAPPRSTIVRIDDRIVVSGKAGDNDRVPDGHWVVRHGSRAEGWEASASIRPGEHRLLVHTLVRLGHRTVHVLTVPRVIDIRIGCPAAPSPTPTAAPTRPPEATATPEPTRTAKPTKSPKPEPTARPTKSPRPDPTARPTKSPKPTRTPKPTRSPKPTCASDTDRHRRHCDDGHGRGGDDGHGRGGDDDKGKGRGADSGIVIILPLAFGATAWATRPKRDPRRLHRRRRPQ